MTDRIFKIGEGAIEAADERVKRLMNNMVNAETPGYRKSDVSIKAFPLELEAAQSRLENKFGSSVPKVERTYYKETPGALIRTGRETDLAIAGDGFFVIEGPFGEGYTRDGRFAVNKEGKLVTANSGFSVIGESGPIIVTPGSKVVITESGEVKVNDEIVDKIKVVTVDDFSKLESVGGSIFRNKGNAVLKELESPKVIQGYIESSNVSMVDSMMELVILSRIYNINTKIISTRDASLTKAIDMGRMQTF